LRYSTPPPSSDGNQNWLLLAMYDYQNALKMHVDAMNDAGQFLAKYNTQLVKLEEAQGTLLESRGITLVDDPCVIVHQHQDRLFGKNPFVESPSDTMPVRPPQTFPTPETAAAPGNRMTSTGETPLPQSRTAGSVNASAIEQTSAARVPLPRADRRSPFPQPGYSFQSDGPEAARPSNYSNIRRSNP
jgi:hypothetical protein